MNLGDIRDQVLDLRAWSPTNAAAVARVSKAVQLAYRKLVDDCPEAVLPANETVVIHKSIDDTSENFKVDVLSGEPYVLEFQHSGGYTGIATDGTWDGLFWIEVTDAGGLIRRHRCREFFTGGSPVKIRVSLDVPWANSSDTALAWRLYQPHVFLPSRVMKVLDAEVWAEGLDRLDIMPRFSAQSLERRSYRDQTAGPPEDFWPDINYQVPAPNRPPIVAIDDVAGAWAGPHNRGKWKVVATRCWGKREFRAAHGPAGLLVPMFESSPTPASAEISNIGVAGKLSITLVDDDFEWNFGAQDANRYQRSGWYWRIYIARSDVDATIASPQSVNNQHVEISPDIYYHLADLAGHSKVYLWYGIIGYDKTQRLQRIGVYQGWRVYPYADKRYELDLKILRQPENLTDDQDAAEIQAWAEGAITVLAEHFVAKLDQDPEAAARLLTQYLVEDRPGLMVSAARLGGNRIDRTVRHRRGHLDHDRYTTMKA